MKKTKKIASLGAVAVIPLVATSVAPALVLSGCGRSKKEENIDINLNYDDENNFDARWFDQFVESYKGAINTQVIEQSGKSPEWRDLQREDLRKSVESFKGSLKELLKNESSRPFAYSAITNAMIDHAYDSYELPNGDRLKLDIRKSNKTFDDINAMFNQETRAADSLMQSTGVSKKNRDLILGNARDAFDELFTQLKNRYADPLSAYIKAQSRLNFIFSEVSDEIALAGASDALSEFLNNYQIEYKQDVEDNANRLDVLLKTKLHDEEDDVDVMFAENTDISAFMSRIFTFRNVTTGQAMPSFKKYEVIPGYKIVPYLKKINKNFHSNEFSIEIDWRVVKQSFVGKKNEKLVTAHIMNPDQNGDLLEKCYKSKTLTLEDLTSEENFVNLTYPVEITQELQHKALENIYFGGNNEIDDPDFPAEMEEEKIEFRFDISNENKLNELAYDPFLDGGLKNDASNDDNIDHVEVDASQLARIGLEVKVTNTVTNGETLDWTRLDKVLGYIKSADDGGEDEKIARPAIIEDFLSNCSIAADCKVHKNSSTRLVDYALFAVYGNTARKALEKIEIETAKVYPYGKDDKHLENLPLTKGLYWSMTNNYNLVRSYVEKYKSNPYAERMEAAEKEKSSRITVLTVTTILSAACAALNFVPFLKPSSRIALAGFCTLSACEIAVGGITYHLWKKHCYEPIKEYYDKAQTFSLTEICQETFAAIEQDGIHNHLLTGESRNGEVYLDKKDYDDNYDEHFSTETNLEALAAFARNYSNINAYPNMTHFNADLKKADIDLVDYNLKKEAGDNQWEETVKVLDAISWSLFGSEMLFMVIDIGVSIYAAYQAKWAAKIAEGKIVKVGQELEKSLAEDGKKIYKIKGESYANFEDVLWYRSIWGPIKSGRYEKIPQSEFYMPIKLSGKEAQDEVLDSIAMMLRDADSGVGNIDIHAGEQGAWETLKEDLTRGLSFAEDGAGHLSGVVGFKDGISKAFGNKYKGLSRFFDGEKGGVFQVLERIFNEQATSQGAKVLSFKSQEMFDQLERRFVRKFLKQWAKRTQTKQYAEVLAGVLKNKQIWSGTREALFQKIDEVFDFAYIAKDLVDWTYVQARSELQFINEAFIEAMETLIGSIFSPEFTKDIIRFL